MSKYYFLDDEETIGRIDIVQMMMVILMRMLLLLEIISNNHDDDDDDDEADDDKDDDEDDDWQASEMLAKDPAGFHQTVQESLRR